MAQQIRVLLVNAWHDDNKGDSAITEGTLRVLHSAFTEHGFEPAFKVVGLAEDGPLAATSTRHLSMSWPDVETLPTPLPTELRAGSGDRPMVNVPIWLTRLVPSAIASLLGRTAPALRDLIDWSDVVIGVGGANLHTDAAVRSFVSLARLYTLAAPLHAASRAGRPVLLIGHTLGPFPARRHVSALVARQMIGTAELAVVREKDSVKIAQDLGLQRVELAPDLAFALEPSGTARVRQIVAAGSVPAHRTVVVAMRAHPSLPEGANHRMVGELIDTIRELSAMGLCEGVLVVAHTIGPTAIEDDRVISGELADRMRAELPGFPVAYLHDDLAPAELAWLYGQMAGMIAVRLHAAILAMITGTPTFAISYFTHKTSGVMSGVGLADCVGDFATVTTDDIVTALAPRIGSREKRDELASVCRSNRELLENRCAEWVSEACANVANKAHERSNAR